jgi:hypothetical protein
MHTSLHPHVQAVVATNKFEKEMAAQFGGGADHDVRCMHVGVCCVFEAGEGGVVVMLCDA